VNSKPHNLPATHFFYVSDVTFIIESCAPLGGTYNNQGSVKKSGSSQHIE